MAKPALFLPLKLLRLCVLLLMLCVLGSTALAQETDPAGEQEPAKEAPPAESADDEAEEESESGAAGENGQEDDEPAEEEQGDASAGEKEDKGKAVRIADKEANVADRPAAATALDDARAPRLLRPPDIVESGTEDESMESAPGALNLEDVDLVVNRAASQAEDEGTESTDGAGNVVEGGATAGDVVAPPPADGSAPGTNEGERTLPQGMTPFGGMNPGETPPPTAAPPPGGGMFSEEELEDFLPDIAREEEGFIPDRDPGDLFGEPEAPGSGASDFGSLLGESELPPGDVQGIIGLHQSLPGRDLLENYARVVVPDGTITGSTESKQFHIEGGLIIYYNDVTITADMADIDEKNEVAVMKGSVVVDDPKYSLKTDVMKIFFEDKRFQASGFVQFKKEADPQKSRPDLSLPKKDRLREYFAGQEFQLFARDLYYNWESKEMNALGDVQLVHPSFSGTMERVDYNDETKQYDIAGDVVLKIHDYGWIFDNKLVEPADEKRIRALTDADTNVTADRLVYDEASGVAQFYGLPGEDVIFDQRKRTITASYIEVNDTTKDFYAEGTPDRQVAYKQLDGKWLFEGELIKRGEVSEDLATSLEEPMDVLADKLVYNYDRKRLELLGGVSITSSSGSLTAGDIIQDETAKFFLMRENVVIRPDDQSEVYAAQVYLDTANDVITFVGLVQGKLFSEDIAAATATEEELEAGEPGFSAPASGAFGAGSGTNQQGSGGNTNRTGTNIAEGEE